MRIFKTLPNGTKVHREVTQDEYVNNGWMKNGWADSTLTGVTTTDHYLQEQAFKDHFQAVPTVELAKYPAKIEIFKYLPNGEKSRHMTMTYGEYVQKGWKDNGWVFEPKARRIFDATVTRQTRKQAEDKLRKMSWWYPKRSYDQAKALQLWTFDSHASKEEREKQIEQLTDMNFVPNPSMRRYSDRLQKYAERKTNQWRKLPRLTPEYQQSWWRTQKSLLDLDGHPMPDPVVTRAQARRAEAPKRSRGESNSAYGWRWTEHSMHYDRFNFPYSWRKWQWE